MAKLVLHIGTTKTGTTAIQSFLARNRDALLDRGYLYPRSLGRENHVKAAAYATPYRQAPDIHQWAGIASSETEMTQKTKIAASFRKEITSARNAHTVIISNESMHARCYQDENLVNLKELLSGLFESVKVVCYLRPQIDHAVSLYATGLRAGGKFTLEEFLARQKSVREHYYHFDVLLSHWGRHFGDENIVVRLFDQEKRRERGVVSSALEILGLQADEASFEPTSRANSSINSTGQKILRLRNQLATPSGAAARTYRAKINDAIERGFPGLGAIPTLQFAQEFQSEFAEGNEFVRKRWFPNEAEILSPDWTKYQSHAAQPEDINYKFIVELIEIINELAELQDKPQKVPQTELQKEPQKASLSSKPATLFSRLPIPFRGRKSR